VLNSPAQHRLPGLRPAGPGSVDVERQPPFVLHVGEEIGVVRKIGADRLQGDHVQVADVVLAHQRHGLRLQDLRAVERAVVQQHLQEADVVPGRAEQGAAAHEELRALRHLERHRLKRRILLAIVHRRDPRLLRGAD
jgi:hypothetical protein